MGLDDYAKRHGLDYESSYARKQREKEEEWQRLHTPPTYNMYADKAAPLNRAVSEYERRKAEGSTPATMPVVAQKLADVVFNRLPSALAGGLIESARAREEQGISEWSPKAIAAGAKGFGSGLTGKERYSYSDWLGEDWGVPEGPTRELTGGMLDIMTSPGGMGSVKIGNTLLCKTGTKALEAATNQAAKKGLLETGKKLTRDAAGVGIGGGLYEGGSTFGETGNIPESMKSAGEGAAMWFATDLGLGAAGIPVRKVLPNAHESVTKGIGSGIGGTIIGTGTGLASGQPLDESIKTGLGTGAVFGGFGALTGAAGGRPKNAKEPPTERSNSLDYLFEEGTPEVTRVEPDFTATPYGVYRGGPRAELPGAPEQLALPPGEQRLALPGGAQKALPPGQDFAFSEGYPVEGYWFVDPYGVARGEPGMPLALPEGKTGQGSRFVRQDEGQIPRSDIGDPEYLAGLEKQYNDLVNAEVAGMKNELGGVETIGQNPYEMQPGMFLNDGYKRVSLNPSWYRDFWQKNSRAPREGELRDLAIKNLMEGNPETGEPANAEFLAIMSELSRGQKLPEEWHGLQRGIRDTTAMQEPELDPLIAEMKAEQAKVEPYGLERDLSRLDEIENRARQNMKDIMNYKKQYPDAMFAVNQEAAFMKNLVTVGACKIARKGIEFKQWATEMVSEFGEIIRTRLPEIWERAKSVLSSEEGFLNLGRGQAGVKFKTSSA